uniref:Zinc finger CCHC domain-containing protein 7 n=1 Tax=Anopheles coluzzii TaxID=1518534 RepID=A0A8W7P3W7_ANOCL
LLLSQFILHFQLKSSCALFCYKMDLEERDLAALEERLYSSIHHAYENPQSVFDPAPVTPSTTARVVSRNAVINNGSGTLPANMKRYWAGSAVPSYGDRGAPYPGNKPQTGVAPKPSSPAATAPGNVSEGGITEVTKMFITPYQSLLGNMGDPPPVESPSVPVESAHQSTPSIVAPAAKHIPQKDPGLQLKKKKQTKQPLLAVEKKLANLTKLINKDRKQNAAQTMEVKKAKAKKMRHRKQQQQHQQIVAEIILNSSDDEVSKPRPARPERTSAPVPLSDDETDEVIIIPTPPPPQICIDCSDEEEERPPPSVQFALPKSQKKKKKKPTSVSPRCLSPSNSSIMSDDFIGQHDRSRLNDSFTESIPNDDELECAVEGAPRPGASGKGKKSTPEARQERVPSISSEDTVCTSSETTDQEKRPQEAEKGSASKSQSQQCNESATKGKKDSATNTKKTPSKVKASKTVPASPSIAAAAVSPSVAKNNANSNKAVATGSNDTASIAKPQGKTKARSKSPLTLVLEAARKHFEMEPKQPRDGSAKKTKSKKDSSVQKEPTATPGTPTDKVVSECAANEPAPSKSTAGPKGKKKKNLTTIAPVDDVVSSESDYDIARPASKASTPKGPPGKKSRRSASNFFEQMGDVSSESDYDESFLQEEKGNEKHKQAKESKKRLGRKRKQYNSETYSDEDFACLLTDIVRAVSDTEDEEDEDDNDDDADGDVAALLANEGKTGTKAADTAATSKKRKQNSLTEQQTPSKAARNAKKKKKLFEQPPAATSEELPADQEQPEVVVAKKKKKQKEPKASAKKRLAGSGCSTPEVQAVCLEQSSTNTPAQRSKDLMEEDSRAVHSATSEPDQIQIIADSDVDGDDDDDDDLRIIDNSFNGRSSVASGGSCSSKAPPVGPDCAWNDEMKQFYNTSWADEDLNLKSILRQMPRDSRHWYLLLKDRYPDPPRKEIICSNCGERGHVRFKCRNTPKLVTCYMCGEQGHREPRCPKTICLNCGAKTRNFVRGCKTCARDADTICFSCGVRGHTQRSCPDLWRRYHSTIEDNVPLKEDFVKNPKARWCCVCCRHGHQAHKCNDARRIFGHPIPNTSVSSYLPAYRGEYNRSSKRQTEEQQRRLALDPTARYNLLSSDANECELNLSEMTQNENGFYYNFLRTTGLLEKYEKRPSVDDVVEVVEQQQQQEEAPPEVKQEKDEVLLIESSPPAEPVVSQQEQDEIEPKEEEMSPQVTPAPCNQTDSQRAALTIVEENSNYSFSEFHTEEEKQPEVACETSGGGITSRPSEDRTSANINSSQSQQAALSLDFIPLSTEPEVPDLFTLPPLPPRPPRPQRPPLPILPTAEQASLPSPQQTPEPPANAIVRAADSDRSIMPKADEPVETDAKVVLSKDHAKVLLSLKGSEFLNEAGQRYNVRLSITFESVGNMLQIHGTTEAQDRFHEELVRYLSGGTQQKQHEEQRFNQEEQQADDYIDTDATMHHNGEGNRRYADDFIMNTYADQQIDSDRLDQLDSSTRHVQESDWIGANGSNYQQQQQQQQQDFPQHGNEWYDDRDQNRWAVFDSTPPQTEHRFQWFGQSSDVGPSGPSGAFPASVARLTEWDNTLREQELSQLERLQNMLRR